MAPETTPRNWPVDNEGLLDDALIAVKKLVKVLHRVWKRLPGLMPKGRLSLSLCPGQTLALDGTGMATVSCREGHVWVTSPGDGRDMTVRGGESVDIQADGRVTVSALSRQSKVIILWG